MESSDDSISYSSEEKIELLLLLAVARRRKKRGTWVRSIFSCRRLQGSTTISYKMLDSLIQSHLLDIYGCL